MQIMLWAYLSERHKKNLQTLHIYWYRTHFHFLFLSNLQFKCIKELSFARTCMKGVCLERLKVSEEYTSLLRMHFFLFSSVAFSCYTMTQPYYYKLSLHFCFFNATCPLWSYKIQIQSYMKSFGWISLLSLLIFYHERYPAWCLLL